MSEINKPITSGLLFDDLEIVCVMDGFEPHLAQIVIDTIGGIKDERVFTVLWDVVCDEAYEKVNRN